MPVAQLGHGTCGSPPGLAMPALACRQHGKRATLRNGHHTSDHRPFRPLVCIASCYTATLLRTAHAALRLGVSISVTVPALTTSLLDATPSSRLSHAPNWLRIAPSMQLHHSDRAQACKSSRCSSCQSHWSSKAPSLHASACNHKPDCCHASALPSAWQLQIRTRSQSAYAHCLHMCHAGASLLAGQQVLARASTLLRECMLSTA